MAYYNEFFIEEENKLVHIGSCTGSDIPCYFDNIKTLDDWNLQLKVVEKENDFWPHKDDVKHPFPWSSYKTSDHLIVLRPSKRKWFEFWKPTHQAWISVDKYDIKDDNKSYFIIADKWGGDCDYDKNDFIILEFTPIK